MQTVPFNEVRAAAAPQPPQGYISSDTIERYLIDIRPGIKPTTYKSYATCLHVFGHWLQDAGINCPQATDILAYKMHLEEAGIAADTRCQYIRLVKAFFAWAAASGIYPDVALHVQGVKSSAYMHHRDALTPDEVQAIEAKIDTSTPKGLRLHAIFLLCISCSLRMIEVSRANIGDIKKHGNRRYLYVQGKGHDDADAPVLLPDDVTAAIDQYLATRQDPMPPQAPLFASTSNRSYGQRIAPTTISTQIKAVMKAAGYDSSRITAHSLRHTSGTAVYKATKNIYLTQQHQRHKDPKTTEIYVHANDRATRTTEDIAYEYLMHNNAADDPRKQAAAIIEQMPADKLDSVLAVLEALNR